jgi:N-acetylmuramoyl-L-alanine amidase
VFGIKVLAICGAAAFTFLSIRGTYKGAEQNAAEKSAIHEATIRQTEVETTMQPETEDTEQEESSYQSLTHSMDWDYEDAYLLAKIAMAEAEGEDTEGKALVMLVVLNRVWSDEFPNSIEEVILEEHNGVHQFSVTQENGRWYTVEPDADCYKALDLIQYEKWDESEGALYFESKSDSEWHRKNLRFLFQHGNHYFYTDKENQE